MKKQKAIHKIMNDVIGWLDEDQVKADFKGSFGAPNDIVGFMFCDPILASLSKKYQDSCARYQTLCDEYGSDDPMLEAAIIARDSADASMQARLIELRENERFVELARLCQIRDEELDEERQHSKFLARMAQENYKDNNKRMAAIRAKREGETNFYLVLYFLTAMEQTLINSRRQLSLASAFFAVNGHDYKKARRAFGSASQ